MKSSKKNVLRTWEENVNENRDLMFGPRLRSYLQITAKSFKCVPTTKWNPVHSEQSPSLIHNRRWRWHHLSEKQLAAGRWLLSRLQLCGPKNNNRVFVPLILHMGARASSRPHLHAVMAEASDGRTTACGVGTDFTEEGKKQWRRSTVTLRL